MIHCARAIASREGQTCCPKRMAGQDALRKHELLGVAAAGQTGAAALLLHAHIRCLSTSYRCGYAQKEWLRLSGSVRRLISEQGLQAPAFSYLAGPPPPLHLLAHKIAALALAVGSDAAPRCPLLMKTVSVLIKQASLCGPHAGGPERRHHTAGRTAQLHRACTNSM